MICLFNCKTCRKKYTGKTTDHFRRRWNNFKSEAKKAVTGTMENFKKKFLQSNILQPEHKGFPKNVEVKLIDKEQDSDPIKQEFCGIRTLKTFYFECLNIESDYSNFFCFQKYF